MAKNVTSPVVKYPGSATIKDPLPLSACVEWEIALSDCQPSPCSEGRKILMHMLGADAATQAEVFSEYTAHFAGCDKCRPAMNDTAAQERMLKAIKPCIESWNVTGFDLSNPPGSPKMSRSKLVAWIIGEINKVYTEEDPDGDPNA